MNLIIVCGLNVHIVISIISLCLILTVKIEAYSCITLS